MKDQHYPGMPWKETVTDHNGKESKGINKMKAYSYNTGIRSIIRVIQGPAANMGNVVDLSNLLKGASELVYFSPLDIVTLNVKEVV
ncbi:hypothetical protein [Paenibacillus sp. AGC30]